MHVTHALRLCHSSTSRMYPITILIYISSLLFWGSFFSHLYLAYLRRRPPSFRAHLRRDLRKTGPSFSRATSFLANRPPFFRRRCDSRTTSSTSTCTSHMVSDASSPPKDIATSGHATELLLLITSLPRFVVADWGILIILCDELGDFTNSNGLPLYRELA